MTNRDNAPPKAITVRLSEDEYERLRRHAASKGVSLNFIAAEAIAVYGAKMERAEVIEDMRTLQSRLRHTQASASDSVQTLRQLRASLGDPSPK